MSSGFATAAVIATAACLGACASGGPDAYSLDVRFNTDGGRGKPLWGFCPLLAVIDFGETVQVQAVQVQGVDSSSALVPLSVPKGAKDLFFVHPFQQASGWGKARLVLGDEARVQVKLVTDHKPLKPMLESLSDRKLSQFLAGVTGDSLSDDMLEALLKEIGRRGGKEWLPQVRPLIHHSRRRLSALVVTRQLEGRPCPVKISPEVVSGAIARLEVIDGSVVYLRIANQDEQETFTIGERGAVFRMKSAEGSVACEVGFTPDIPGSIGAPMTRLHDIAPGHSQLIPIWRQETRLPKGEYEVEWTYHDSSRAEECDHLEDLVVFQGRSKVMIRE